MPTYTVGRLAKRFGLSRSTLLYYDSIGLLPPAGRSESNYRIYGEAACRRLELICQYREVGLPLAEIREILGRPRGKTAKILARRLEELNREIHRCREQQRVVVQLLRSQQALKRSRSMTKAAWVGVLKASGLTDEDMSRWHAEFERRAPEAHRDFLESLGIPAREIKSIRARARKRALRPARESGHPISDA